MEFYGKELSRGQRQKGKGKRQKGGGQGAEGGEQRAKSRIRKEGCYLFGKMASLGAGKSQNQNAAAPDGVAG